jgi:hypothetical protein
MLLASALYQDGQPPMLPGRSDAFANVVHEVKEYVRIQSRKDCAGNLICF